MIGKRGKSKKASIELSFNMIFSIFVIIAILALSIYVITYFLSLKKCTETGMFYKEFENRIDKAWVGETTRDAFTGSLGSGIEYVCFGNLTKPASSNLYKEQYDSLKKYYSRKDANIFLYPRGKSCESSYDYSKIEHLETGSFFCEPVIKGKVSIKISMDVGDALVKVVD